MFRVSGCVEEVLMCVCRFDEEVCGDGVVFVDCTCLSLKWCCSLYLPLLYLPLSNNSFVLPRSR